MQNGGIGSFRGAGAGQRETREAVRDRAEALAIEALAWLAGDTEAISRFLSLAGIDPGGLREAAAEPGFLAGVLEYLASDESLLTAFAANAGRNPAEIERARRTLAPPEAFD